MPKEKVKCKYPNCQLCTEDYCIRDTDISQNLPPISKDKKAYDREWYRKNKMAKNAYSKEYYQKNKIDQNQYLKWLDVKRAIYKLRKQIGEVNFEMIMNEINELERKKGNEVINTHTVLQRRKVH